MNIKKVKETNFKYTTNKERKKYIKQLYPYGEYLIELISKIPWNEYKYQGEFRAWYMNENDQFKYDDLEVEAQYKKSTTPFYFFGGASYELLNSTYKSVDLHKYVDPTADIDIGLQLPFVEIEKSEKEYIHYFFDSEERSFDSLSKLVKDFTNWVLEQTVSIFEKIPSSIFDDIFGDCENISSKDYRTVRKKIGFRLFYENDAVKIQGVCKFRDVSEEHFLELILSLNDLEDTVFLNRKSKSLLKLKENIYITDIKSLFIGDMIALQTRIHAVNTNEYKELKHKFYNHIGRFNYLIEFISKSIIKENRLNLSTSEITNLIDYSLKIFILYYLLKVSNKLKLVDYTSKLNDKSIVNNSIRDYYELLKDKKRLKENQTALSLENKSFKKSQIDGLEVDFKKRTDSKEPYILYKNVYEELFPSLEGGKRRATRKLKYHSSR